MGELANAAVLFSVHRRANAGGSSHGGGSNDAAKGRAEREGLLGQVSHPSVVAALFGANIFLRIGRI